MEENLKLLQVIENALNLANQKGAFNLKEASFVASAFERLAKNLQDEEVLTVPEPKSSDNEKSKK